MTSFHHSVGASIGSLQLSGCFPLRYAAAHVLRHSIWCAGKRPCQFLARFEIQGFDFWMRMREMQQDSHDEVRSRGVSAEYHGRRKPFCFVEDISESLNGLSQLSWVGCARS